MQKALSHGKVVEIIEQGSTLTRIKPEGGDTFDAVWVKTNSLKPLPRVKEPKGHVEVASLTIATDDVVLPTTAPVQRFIPASTDYETFLPAWLQNPRLRLHTRCATLEAACGDYFAWTGGDTFPVENITAISEPTKRYTWSPFPEWQLSFTYDETVKYPFPIVSVGMGGGIKLGEPAGILKGSRVSVSFKSIIEPLVRKGLRAEN